MEVFFFFFFFKLRLRSIYEFTISVEEAALCKPAAGASQRVSPASVSNNPQRSENSV